MIYAIQAGKNGPIKFGIAADPKKRLCELQVGQYQELMLLGAQKTSNDQAVEREVHERCRADAIRGEWFKPSERVGTIVLRIGLGIVEEYLSESAKPPTALRYPRYMGVAFNVIKHFAKKHAGKPEMLPYG